MFLLLYTKLKFETDDSQEAFVNKLKHHAAFSKKNFFTATIEDYAVNTDVLDNKIVVWSKFGRGAFRAIVTVASAQKTVITVRLVPHI